MAAAAGTHTRTKKKATLARAFSHLRVGQLSHIVPWIRAVPDPGVDAETLSAMPTQSYEVWNLSLFLQTDPAIHSQRCFCFANLRRGRQPSRLCCAMTDALPIVEGAGAHLVGIGMKKVRVVEEDVQDRGRLSLGLMPFKFSFLAQ